MSSTRSFRTPKKDALSSTHPTALASPSSRVPYRPSVRSSDAAQFANQLVAVHDEHARHSAAFGGLVHRLGAAPARGSHPDLLALWLHIRRSPPGSAHARPSCRLGACHGRAAGSARVRQTPLVCVALSPQCRVTAGLSTPPKTAVRPTSASVVRKPPGTPGVAPSPKVSHSVLLNRTHAAQPPLNGTSALARSGPLSHDAGGMSTPVHQVSRSAFAKAAPADPLGIIVLHSSSHEWSQRLDALMRLKTLLGCVPSAGVVDHSSTPSNEPTLSELNIQQINDLFTKLVRARDASGRACSHPQLADLNKTVFSEAVDVLHQYYGRYPVCGAVFFIRAAHAGQGDIRWTANLLAALFAKANALDITLLTQEKARRTRARSVPIGVQISALLDLIRHSHAPDAQVRLVQVSPAALSVCSGSS